MTDSDVSEPAIAVLLTIASSGDDEAKASDLSANQKHIVHIDASSDELDILEAKSVAAAAAVATADARLRFLERAARLPRSHRRRPGRQFLLLTVCLIVTASDNSFSF